MASFWRELVELFFEVLLLRLELDADFFLPAWE
jgi:hypothetical protein